MAWFHFSQNNSGGSFSFDEEAGITHHVVIEADTAWLANQRAQHIGIYFNGCDDGLDCPCCGDRWSEPCDNEGDKDPMVYGSPVEKFAGMAWMKEGKEIAVHPIDQPIRWYGVNREPGA